MAEAVIIDNGLRHESVKIIISYIIYVYISNVLHICPIFQGTCLMSQDVVCIKKNYEKCNVLKPETLLKRESKAVVIL